MTTGPASRLAFELKLSRAPDALLRVLDIFALQGASFERIEMGGVVGDLVLRLEVGGVAVERVAYLCDRLSTSLFVVAAERLQGRSAPS